jgi:hypothetical protein
MIEIMPDQVQKIVAAIVDKKTRLVFNGGIGSELNPQVVAFDDQGNVLGVAEMKIGVETHFEQFENLVYVASLMRSGWHASSIALCMEGYMALGLTEKRSSVPLSELFAANDQNVMECLTVVWHSENDESAVYSLPFRIGLGRSVEFLDHEGRGVQNKIVGPYQEGLERVFKEVGIAKYSKDLPRQLYLFSVAMMINKNGFDVDSDLLSEATDWIEKNKHKYEN